MFSVVSLSSEDPGHPEITEGDVQGEEVITQVVGGQGSHAGGGVCSLKTQEQLWEKLLGEGEATPLAESREAPASSTPPSSREALTGLGQPHPSGVQGGSRRGLKADRPGQLGEPGAWA